MRKLVKHPSLVHAEKVLKLVRKRWDGLPEATRENLRTAVIQTWSNGREQGFHISLRDSAAEADRAVVFAEQRSSDQVVVLAGDASRFDITTNMPDEKLWDEAVHCFSDDDEAADQIMRFLAGDTAALRSRSKDEQGVEEIERMAGTFDRLGAKKEAEEAREAGAKLREKLGKKPK